MMQSACAIFAEICLCPWCFRVTKLIKMGNVSCTPKGSSLESILDTFRPEGPRVTRKYTISQLAVPCQGEEHSDNTGLGSPLNLRSPITIFPTGAPGNWQWELQLQFGSSPREGKLQHYRELSKAYWDLESPLGHSCRLVLRHLFAIRFFSFSVISC